VKIGHKLQSLGKISNISADDPQFFQVISNQHWLLECRNLLLPTARTTFWTSHKRWRWRSGYLI